MENSQRKERTNANRDWWTGTLRETDRPQMQLSRPGGTMRQVRRSVVGGQRTPGTLLALQRSLGNRMVGNLLHGQQGTSPAHAAGGSVFRQAEDGESEEVAIDPSGLGGERELSGSGDTGSMAGGENVPTVMMQGGGTGGVTVDVEMTANTPTEISKPAASIAAAHSKPNVAGWCTPKYNIAVPSVNRSSIDVDVTLDFEVELASEYTGQVRNVLRDHEYGHVKIGTQKGQAHLVKDLKNGLKAFPAFTSGPPIQTQIVNAGNRFVAEEDKASKAYDNMDYPRMAQAYIGARLPLSQLMTQSPNTAKMVRALKQFKPSFRDMNKAVGPAQAALSARDALTDDEVARLQYNTEFKTLVEGCRTRVDAFVESHHWDFWLFEFSTLGQSTRTKLQELRVTLDDFQWAAPV